MDPGNWLAGGAIVGVLAAGWAHVKAVLWRAISLIVCRVEFDTSIANLVLERMLEDGPPSRFYDRFYKAGYMYRKSIDSYSVVAFDLLRPRKLVFWRNHLPILWNGQSSGHIGGTLMFLRGTLDIDQLIAVATEKYGREVKSGENERRWVVYFPDNKAGAEIGGSRPVSQALFAPTGSQNEVVAAHELWRTPMAASHDCLFNRIIGVDRADITSGPVAPEQRALDHLVLPAHVLAATREIERWKNSKDWYRSRGIPWQRGWLLYGPPGSGKTAMIKALGYDLNLPVNVLSLGEMTNQSFRSSWANIRSSAPGIALMEDFDNVFHGRENIARPAGSGGAYAMAGAISRMSQRGKKSDQPGTEQDNFDPEASFGSLTFDTVLNTIGGVSDNDGIFIVVTTNDITKIDEALGRPNDSGVSTRPGRLDRVIELTYMEPELKLVLAEKILADYPELIEKFKAEQIDRPETPAQVQDRCVQLALAEFWAREHDNTRGAVPAGMPYDVPPTPSNYWDQFVPSKKVLADLGVKR